MIAECGMRILTSPQRKQGSMIADCGLVPKGRQYLAGGVSPRNGALLRIQPQRGGRSTDVQCSFAPLGLGII